MYAKALVLSVCVWAFGCPGIAAAAAAPAEGEGPRVPAIELAAKITAPKGIEGKSLAYPTKEWLKIDHDRKSRRDVVGEELGAFLDAAVKAVYP